MIKIKNLWKSFNGLKVLKGLDLEVETGETVVILGRSGVGKSVLLKQILGLQQPDSGSVEVDGIEISSLKESERSKLTHMGMLFQGSALFDSMNVEENTAFFLREHGDLETGKPFPEAKIQEKVKAALKMVGLEGTQKVMPSDLSGGMRKRAGIARLIVYRPKLLLYDEPTTGLDPITANQINDLILVTQKELHATSIVVTHDLQSAMIVGDRLAFHHDGKIRQLAKKEDFLQIDDPELQAFLKCSLLGTKNKL